MALLTFEDYTGKRIEINPALVQSVSTYQHYDHDRALPDELMIRNGDDLPEVNPEKRAEADALRTSERTIVAYASGAVVVKGTLDEVKKALTQDEAKKPART